MPFEGAEESVVDRPCAEDDQAEDDRIAMQTDISAQINY